MTLIEEWLETYRNVLTSPAEFFESESRRDGFGFPLKFAAINIVLYGVLGAGSSLIWGIINSILLGSGSIIGTFIWSLGELFLSPIVGIVALMIWAGIVHVFATLLGAEKGYSQTLSSLEYATAVYPIYALLTFIPIIGALVGLFVLLYAWILAAMGIKNFQNISIGRAFASLLIPFAIAVTILVVISMLVLGGIVALLAA